VRVETLPLTGERTVPGIDRENYWFRRHEAAYRWAVDVLPIAGGVVVDAGSGEGYGAEQLRRAGAARVVALELDEQAALHSTRQYPGLLTVRANLDALPLPDAGADVVVTMQVVEHLWDLPGFLRECRRVLRPAGVLLAATPNRLTFSPGLGRGQRPTNPFHVEEFDAGQFADLLAAAGFGDVEVLGLHHRPALPADLVARQIAAVLADDWPADLLAAVSAVQVDDFEVRRTGLPESLDLLAVGRVSSVGHGA
jgi:SAM-dependent methyltransferase